MADRANVTPVVLKWARETAKISPEIAALKAAIDTDKLLEWEAGTGLPTIKQAQKLAKVYKRPFAIFFLPEPPIDFQPLKDFRKKSAKPLGTASEFIIRELRQKQEWMREFYQENGEEKLPFVGKFSSSDDPAKVAADILQTLQIDPAHYKTVNPYREWIASAERAGIFISRTSLIHSKLLLDSDEMQGFALADQHAPFVFINSNDWDTPQLFTLVHELAHVWIAASGISNDIIPQAKSAGHPEPVEYFCNEVAASALMPYQIIKKLDPSLFHSQEKLYKTSKIFGVSSLALLVRGYNLGLISLEKYRVIKNILDKEFQKYIEKETAKKLASKEKEGGPNYYLLLANKNGKLFTQTVIDAFKGGFIQPTQASSLLNISLTKFPKMLAQLY
ncbi:MAG TPA: XRE family transcriptional regulator [Candidatus Kapabacteria bacterium]|nr:XRE family transcriptional regulator [Candidatus Kapabacteria bacterium]